MKTKSFSTYSSLFLISIIFLNISFLTTFGKEVDTGQTKCYNAKNEISCPQKGELYYGQDGNYQSNQPAYQDNNDGTITDLNTELIWSKAVDTKKISLTEAKKIALEMSLGGYADWRVPNIKELYTLIDFNGYTGGTRNMNSIPSNAVPFINTNYFDFEYGDINNGERYIDAQWLSSTKYVSTTMDGAETLFGVNFADGRIKGYGYSNPNRPKHEKKFYARYVRGEIYGNNDFQDNNNGTITDHTNGLTWTKNDSKYGMNWQESLSYCENLQTADFNDWRLPNAKELQYIVDYTRSPDTTNSPAIDPIFNTSSIINEIDQKDYPYFWTSTTHLDGPVPSSNAAYVSFGKAIGQMRGQIMDVHGAGAQRSDPKTGQASLGNGPQGDARRTDNYARCVRDSHNEIYTNEKVESEINNSEPISDTKLEDNSQFKNSQSLNNNQKDFFFLLFQDLPFQLFHQPQQKNFQNKINNKSRKLKVKEPPQEAIKVCINSNQGNYCSFESPRGLIEGKCLIPPEKDQLICVPER